MEQVSVAFRRAVEAWKDASLGSDDAVAAFIARAVQFVDNSTNVYLTSFDDEDPEHFGFRFLVNNFDIRVGSEPGDFLGNHPDRVHVSRDLAPQYHHVAQSGEMRVDSIRDVIWNHYAHYDRVILPVDIDPRTKRPRHAIALSKPRFIIAPTEGDVRNLSGREAEILNFVANGLTTKEIAREIGSSPRTVETHLVSIKKKMNARNIAHAVALHVLRASF
ncbi:helix-turn-helix transcriptional regulator [Dongia rigui]|uniref:Helix-turn-helix transcriptional regulator n=1 Tax=Dongia rigui TaxID=940149 RepID=A0ABU5E1B9_9PROT|nr:helix-turn-helix transcriptional regulator [Dongia rigui]MDY0873396.1 helix-turn-helix transcriptional regulator [Dongia rigui]